MDPPLRRPLCGHTVPMDMELAQRMLDVVAAVPSGRVITYGDVAARAGRRAPPRAGLGVAHLAGFVLANLADEATPWHRVLRSNGTPAPQLAAEQLARLRVEGVLAVDGRVDLRRYRWSD